MLPLAKTFLDSLKAQLSASGASLSEYITTNTYIKGRKFSFHKHEYQEYITKIVESSPGATIVVKKSSQIGLSEIFQRIILARMALRPGEAVLISFPSIKLSQETIRTRIAGIIEGSPALSAIIDPNVDSASVKKFTNDSILYGLAGSANSGAALISRAISLVLIDEVDRQSPECYTAFRSRQTHTAPEDRLTLMISTPTSPDVGIDAEFNDCSIQHYSQLRCNACSHLWEPSYYEDVKIPDYDEAIALLTKAKAAKLRIDQAYLECPGCGAHLNYENSSVEYNIVENQEGTANKIGVALTPFVALGFISIPDLVASSLAYASQEEFRQQGLGLTTALSDSSILASNIHFCSSEQRGGARIFGLDMGKECHFLSGLLRSDTTIHVDRAEIIKLPDLEDFLVDFFRSNSTVAGIMDSMPYADLVYKLVKKHPRLYSAIYVDPLTPMPELFQLKMNDKHGQIVRQVNINKNKVMDMMAGALPDLITFEPTPLNHLIIQHLTDMRRARDYRFEQPVYKWVKSQGGADHFHHTLTYLFMASHLAYAGIGHGSCVAPVQVFTFHNREKGFPELLSQSSY